MKLVRFFPILLLLIFTLNPTAWAQPVSQTTVEEKRVLIHAVASGKLQLRNTSGGEVVEEFDLLESE